MRIQGVFLVLLGFIFTSCAIESGRGWGEADLGAQFSLLVEAGRGGSSEGFYRDIRNHEVRFEDLSLQLEGIILHYGSRGGHSVFDPSSPPPPYSNCHAGHCHLPDGSTKDFAEIEAEMSAGGSESGKQIHAKCRKVVDVVKGGVSQDFVFECVKGLGLEKGEIIKVSLLISGISVSGSVKFEDGQEKAFSYLDQGKEYFVKRSYLLKVGRGSKYSHKINFGVRLSVNFIDKVLWDILGDSSDAQKGLVESMLAEIKVLGL